MKLIEKMSVNLSQLKAGDIMCYVPLRTIEICYTNTQWYRGSDSNRHGVTTTGF